MTKVLSALLLFALFTPVAHAASLTADAGVVAQAVDVGIDVQMDVATGTPSDSSAGDDADLGVSVMSSSDVADEDDLERYQTSLKGEDAYYDDAVMDADGYIAISYYHEGRFLGLVPVQVKSHTTVATNTDGQVTVKTHMPWWNLFVSGTADIASDIDARLAGSGTLASDSKMTDNAAAKARIIEAVVQAHTQARIAAAGR